ncbi:MAG: conserved rane protein of unknown function, partial [Dehalococcoidia bacterium]|nr:conserved rane protein of unknown function [Dehalococcoidia bacterium]
EGVLELLRAHGLGDGAFWQWVGINGLNNPYNSTHWYPTDNWWWWRATRVIGATVDGRSLDYTITEFPFFSFLLGDLHPHVMALPFVFLALALSLNLLLTGVTPGYAILRGRPFHLLGTALCLGSLGFINSWDYPTYTLVFLGSGLLCWLSLQRGFAARSLINFLGWAAGVVTVSLLLYAPFYWNTGLGLLAVLTPGGNGSDHLSKLPIALWSGPYTRPFHFLLIWALFFFLTGSYIFHRAISRYRHKIIAVAAGVSLLILWMAVEWGLSANPQGSEALLLTLAQRGWLLAPLLAIGVTILSRADGRVEGHASPDGPNEAPNVFVGLLIALALVLFLLCETVFLRDVFGNRMNTVFKLYYQAWVLLAVASAFALYYVISWDWGISVAQSLFGKSAWLGIGALLVVGAAIYPVASVRDRTGAFRSATTLDGLDYVSRSDPAEAAAIAWIAANVGCPRS